MRRLGLVALMVLAVGTAGACEPGAVVIPSDVKVIIPPGVQSTQTADQVSQKMMDVIATNEQAVGRELARPRIIRIQLLKPGEGWSVSQLDGTGEMHSVGGQERERQPRWLVEAVGTFIDPIGRDGGLPSSIGTHGYRIWADDGSGTYDWFPCWVRTRDQMNADNMEGECAPPNS